MWYLFQNLDETATDGEVGEFFDCLGGGSPDDIADEDSAMDDTEFERKETVSLREWLGFCLKATNERQDIGTGALH